MPAENIYVRVVSNRSAKVQLQGRAGHRAEVMIGGMPFRAPARGCEQGFMAFETAMAIARSAAKQLGIENVEVLG